MTENGNDSEASATVAPRHSTISQVHRPFPYIIGIAYNVKLCAPMFFLFLMTVMHRLFQYSRMNGICTYFKVIHYPGITC